MSCTFTFSDVKIENKNLSNIINHEIIAIFVVFNGFYRNSDRAKFCASIAIFATTVRTL